MGKTLFDKIWDKHVVQNVEDGPTQLYIDRLYAHEVTSPQAFDTLRDHRRTMYAHATFTLQIVESPNIVITREEMYLDSPIRKF